MTNIDRSAADRIASWGRWGGFLIFLVVLFLPSPPELSPEAKRLVAVTLLMATFWLTRAIPIAATSLIPIALFPLLGIMKAEEISQVYMNKSVLLFLGGFIIALGIEKWRLHRRIALTVVWILGTSIRRLVLGFMVATAFLSMWISNSASTLLMLPIALAMLSTLKELDDGSEDGGSEDGGSESETESSSSAVNEQLSVVLMLAVAYSASVGGFTTLVGTPTNVQFREIWKQQFSEAPEISAGQWMFAVLPLGCAILLIAWYSLVRSLPQFPSLREHGRRFFRERLRALGRMQSAEFKMLLVFILTASLWAFRAPLQFGDLTLLGGWGQWVAEGLVKLGIDSEIADEFVDDSTVAMLMALVMFLIPAHRDSDGTTHFLMDWETAEKLPWGILLLIGGGFALANGFKITGLSAWIGNMAASSMHDWPLWLMVLAICFLLSLLTEFTSNVATVSVFLPILAQVAIHESVHVDPRLIMIPATVTCSCAFMLPIATPPNAIVFGSGRLTILQMVRHGFVLNMICVVLITCYTFWVLVPLLGISVDQFPDWAIRP